MLTEAGLPVTSVEAVTGSPEMLGGRVKTLHPKIHAGLLADRRDPEHERQLEEHGIAPFDLLVAGLYPFRETVASGAVCTDWINTRRPFSSTSSWTAEAPCGVGSSAGIRGIIVSSRPLCPNGRTQSICRGRLSR